MLEPALFGFQGKHMSCDHFYCCLFLNKIFLYLFATLTFKFKRDFTIVSCFVSMLADLTRHLLIYLQLVASVSRHLFRTKGIIVSIKSVVSQALLSVDQLKYSLTLHWLSQRQHKRSCAS